MTTNIYNDPEPLVDPDLEREVARRMTLPDWAQRLAEQCPPEDYQRLVDMLEQPDE
jgi:hypothetical protein